jgi:hypothetical protein
LRLPACDAEDSQRRSGQGFSVSIYVQLVPYSPSLLI